MAMTDKLNEQLSACVDDELDRREMPLLLARLARDPEMSARWARYNLVGDTIRNTLPGTIQRGFAARVAEIVGAAGAPTSAPRNWARSLGGLAIAASVAAAVLLNLRVDDTGPDPSLVVPVTENPRTPEVARYAVTGGAQWERARPEVQAQLNAFLLDHADRVTQEAGEAATEEPEEERP